MILTVFGGASLKTTSFFVPLIAAKDAEPVSRLFDLPDSMGERS